MCEVLTCIMLGIVFLLCWYLGAVLTAFILECLNHPWVDDADTPPLILIWPLVAFFGVLAIPVIWIIDHVELPDLASISPVRLAAIIHKRIKGISLLSFPRKVYRWSINQYYKLRGITDL